MVKIEWKCPNCWTKYEIDEKYSNALKKKKNCKFCVRKNKNIPTTAEMDGLLTVEDMRNRYMVVIQCMNCNKWTAHSDWHVGKYNKHIPCAKCGKLNYDLTSIKSLRSYNPDTDNKRRAKVAVKQQRAKSQGFN
jgi:hypothetical protein